MKQEIKPTAGDGVALYEGDRVYSYDVDQRRQYGTLSVSDHPATLGHWSIDYDDGESFIVLDFNHVFKP